MPNQHFLLQRNDPPHLSYDDTEGGHLSRDVSEQHALPDETLQLQLDESFNLNRIPLSSSSGSETDNPIDVVNSGQPAKVGHSYIIFYMQTKLTELKILYAFSPNNVLLYFVSIIRSPHVEN